MQWKMSFLGLVYFSNTLFIPLLYARNLEDRSVIKEDRSVIKVEYEDNSVNININNILLKRVSFSLLLFSMISLYCKDAKLFQKKTSEIDKQRKFFELIFNDDRSDVQSDCNYDYFSIICDKESIISYIAHVSHQVDALFKLKKITEKQVQTIVSFLAHMYIQYQVKYRDIYKDSMNDVVRNDENKLIIYTSFSKKLKEEIIKEHESNISYLIEYMHSLSYFLRHAYYGFDANPLDYDKLRRDFPELDDQWGNIKIIPCDIIAKINQYNDYYTQCQEHDGILTEILRLKNNLFDFMSHFELFELNEMRSSFSRFYFINHSYYKRFPDLRSNSNFTIDDNECQRYLLFDLFIYPMMQVFLDFFTNETDGKYSGPLDRVFTNYILTKDDFFFNFKNKVILNKEKLFTLLEKDRAGNVNQRVTIYNEVIKQIEEEGLYPEEFFLYMHGVFLHQLPSRILNEKGLILPQVLTRKSTCTKWAIENKKVSNGDYSSAKAASRSLVSEYVPKILSNREEIKKSNYGNDAISFYNDEKRLELRFPLALIYEAR